jgi:glycosyltransferase involved in cell wall biosynthesis
MRHVRETIPIISEADVVLSDGEHLGIPLALAMIPRRIHTPHVCIGHHLLTPAKRQVFNILQPQRRMDRVVVHSRNQIELVNRALPRVAPLIRVVPYAVDIDFWSPIGQDPDPTLIVSAGREHRDYATLVSALPRSAELFVADHSVFSPDAWGRAPAYWPPHVRRGALDPIGLRELYARAAVVVVPVVDTDFPAGITTLLEAMAMGKAVVVSGTDALCEVVDDGKSGVVVPTGDVGAMAEALDALLADSATRQALGAEARRAVMDRYSLNGYVDALAQQLKDVACARDRYPQRRRATADSLRRASEACSRLLPSFGDKGRRERSAVATRSDGQQPQERQRPRRGLTGITDRSGLEIGERNETSSNKHSTTRKIGVLFIHTATLPPLGADTWVHAQIMRNLDTNAHQLYAACARKSPNGSTPTFRELRTIPLLEVRNVDFGPEVSGNSRSRKVIAVLRSLKAITSILGLVVFIKRRQVAIIHTSDRPRDAFAAVLLGRLTGATSVVHVHVAYGEWMSPLLKWSLRRSDTLIAISDFVRDSLIENGHDPERIYVVHNGIDLHRWNEAGDGGNIREEFGVSADAPALLTVCRLFPAKGPADLIRVLPEIAAEHQDVRLFIVGQEMVHGYLSELVALAKALGVAANVVFTGRRDDVPAFMAMADVFAMPSIGEPFGLVFLEAMAMALPVVALRSGGAPEVVEHGVTGWLSEPGDLEALRDHLLSLLRSPGEQCAMGSRGRRRLEDEFTSARMARDVEEVYGCLLSRNWPASSGRSA